MSISSIGVQTILPQTGTGWQPPNPTPDRANDNGTDDASRQPSQAPRTPETGHIVDKTV